MVLFTTMMSAVLRPKALFSPAISTSKICSMINIWEHAIIIAPATNAIKDELPDMTIKRAVVISSAFAMMDVVL